MKAGMIFIFLIGLGIAIAGCGKKAEIVESPPPQTAELPALPQNQLDQTNMPEGQLQEGKDTSFHESPNDGMKQIPEEDLEEISKHAD